MPSVELGAVVWPSKIAATAINPDILLRTGSRLTRLPDLVLLGFASIYKSSAQFGILSSYP
ncbi:MAG TPA: hypothetical protein V6C90_20725 [Coleofasciculaceae cyanobacterium]